MGSSKLMLRCYSVMHLAVGRGSSHAFGDGIEINRYYRFLHEHVAKEILSHIRSILLQIQLQPVNAISVYKLNLTYKQGSLEMAFKLLKPIKKKAVINTSFIQIILASTIGLAIKV